MSSFKDYWLFLKTQFNPRDQYRSRRYLRIIYRSIDREPLRWYQGWINPYKAWRKRPSLPDDHPSMVTLSEMIKAIKEKEKQI